MPVELIGAGSGVAGAAIMIFTAYKYLVGQMREDRRYMENRLNNIIKDYNEVCRNNQDILVKHTQVLTELITWLKATNGRNLEK